MPRTNSCDSNLLVGLYVEDHPFHIHINPFQITEVFDPNENLVNPETGTLLTHLQVTDKNGQTGMMTKDECDKLADDSHCGDNSCAALRHG
jgi:hypothetical protein